LSRSAPLDGQWAGDEGGRMESARSSEGPTSGGGLHQRFRQAFDDPRGIWGGLALSLMARLNRPVNRWAVELLDVGPDDGFLDVGCGPGLALEEAARRAVRGHVVGVDRSPLAVRRARRRNRKSVRNGRIELQRASADQLPFSDACFTKACTINGVGLHDEAAWSELSRVLKTGGLLAAVFRTWRTDGRKGRFDRSRYFGATDAQLAAVAATLERHSFGSVRLMRAEPGGELATAVVAVRNDRKARG
jgi:SAM-dependent methyltransferase